MISPSRFTGIGRACLLGATLILATSNLTAQERDIQEHRGLWGGFGLGGGHSGNTTLGGSGGLGLGGYLRIGATPSQRVLLSLETIAWVKNEGIVRHLRGNVSAAALFYPSPAGGFYLKGAAGIAQVQVSEQVGDRTFLTDAHAGFGTTWGLGYDIRMARNLYLTPNIDVIFQAVYQETSTVKHAMMVITLGMVMH